ncbi:MAG TPA: 2,3-bisphosphoglycerate-independent phosphoglycerate mutase [Smithellaceae bacterium]|nr:2,3-bisphosphoglycerate-independent phosphoglycerate mutase [Smithellaceae bacterium]
MGQDIISRLIRKNEKKIIFLIMDGLGGLPQNPGGLTELEAAVTPNLDRLAAAGTCGLLDPVGYGITPGSGPAHFALFGYDPVVFNVGRGLLGAAGLEFDMNEGDLYIRANFATRDKNGLITDRRAGRITTEKNQQLCALLQKKIVLSSGRKAFFVTEKEHRALVALRGANLSEEIAETDPQKTGLSALPPVALSPEAGQTAADIAELLMQVNKTLEEEEKANTLLLRGYAAWRRFPSFNERYGLNALAIASYPMYRGIARLLGMEVAAMTGTVEEELAVLRENYSAYNFFFIHIKYTDSRGEDGKFAEKVKVIEKIDALMPEICSLHPDVLVVTGDHSTPAAMSGHSWHPVPVLLAAATCRPDLAASFGERSCLNGGLGRFPMKHLLALALAHAGKLEKFGA